MHTTNSINGKLGVNSLLFVVLIGKVVAVRASDVEIVGNGKRFGYTLAPLYVNDATEIQV